MSLLLDRRPRSNRFLAWKIRIFVAAAVVAVVGMYLDNPYVTGAALVLLVFGMLLRLIPDRRGAIDHEDAEGQSESGNRP